MVSPDVCAMWTSMTTAQAYIPSRNASHSIARASNFLLFSELPYPSPVLLSELAPTYWESRICYIKLSFCIISHCLSVHPFGAWIQSPSLRMAEGTFTLHFPLSWSRMLIIHWDLKWGMSHCACRSSYADAMMDGWGGFCGTQIFLSASQLLVGGIERLS